MRVPLGIVVAVGLAVGMVVGVKISAQQPGGPSLARTGTALVDMNSITQNSTRLKQAMEALKAEYQAKAEGLKKEGEMGNKRTEEVRKMPSGSPERKKAEQDLMKLRADFELHGKRVNDDTRDAETKIIYGMLRELKEELGRYAQANGVQLILRNDPTPPELIDGRAILQEIQKPIVYQRGGDVTPAILEAMNRRGPAGKGPAKAAPR